jgi:hypothetical protein
MTRDERVEAMSRDTQRLCKPGRAPDRLARHRSTSGRLHFGPLVYLANRLVSPRSAHVRCSLRTGLLPHIFADSSGLASPI